MRFVYFLLVLSLILTGCSSAPQAIPGSTQTSNSSIPTEQPVPTATTSSPEANPASTKTPSSTDQPTSTEDLVRIDEQGAVVVEVTPVNLSNPGEAIEFEVVLDTHSIDLSMDLAPLATLSTESGETVQASQWEAPRGGHHVSGKLIFPASVDGQPILEGAKKLTLTIKGLDAPERIFSWELNP